MSVLQFPTVREIPDGYISGPDLASAADISYRQLDYWVRTGHLHPAQRPTDAGSGIPRYFPTSELTAAILVRRLLDAGLQPGPAFPLARQLLEHGHAQLAGIRLDLPQDL